MKTAKVIFYLRPEKANVQTGEEPIYCRITVDRKRSNISTNRWIHPTRWESTDKLQKARKNEDKELNFYLESIRNRIKELERELLDQRIPITAENIKNAYTGTGKKSKSLIEVFEWHNKKFQDLVTAEERSQGTLDRYECVLLHLKNFIKLKFNRTDLYLEELVSSFAEDFEQYLRSVRINEKGHNLKCDNNSTVKYVRNFRRIIKVAVKQGWIKVDPFSTYDGKVRQVDKHFLTPDEIDILKNKEISTPRLRLILDIFLFSIFSGYSYSDVKKLTYDHMQRHIDSQLWIFTKRQKTKVDENVMLLHPALELIDKYRHHPVCKAKGVLFPIPTNQKVNEYLKEIADICGIKKNLTFHVARHTFATSIMLANGVPMETVMYAIGHKYIKQTQHYAKMLRAKVSADMQELNNKLKSN